MKFKAFEGIKCDFCDFKNENIRGEEYFSYVNKPCPICGKALLTVEDFEVAIKIEELFENPIFAKIMRVVIDPSKNLYINLHGKGFENIEIKLIEKE